MVMTNEEIARDYRLAKDKNAQVGILAELNACKKEEIIDILVKEGAISGVKKKKEKTVAYNEKPEDNDIIRWYNEGMKMAEIAERLGLTFYAVQKRIENMKKAGIVQDRGSIKKGSKKKDIEVIDYKDKDMNREEAEKDNPSTAKAVPVSPVGSVGDKRLPPAIIAPLDKGRLGSIHIDAGNVSIFISFR